MAKPKADQPVATFQAPEPGTPEHAAWLDGPRPEAGNGRGQWLRARQLRGNAAKAEAKAQSRTVEPSGGQAPTAAAPAALRDADDLGHLDAIIHSSAALASDRIRAIEAKQRILNRIEAEEAQAEHGPLVALRDALSALPSDERVGALAGLIRVEGQG